jgi:DNA-binding transcriptional MerR regulator
MGLLQPERVRNQRRYSDRDRVRLKLILRGRRLGFSLPEIRDMLDLYETDPTEVTQLREVIRRGDLKLAEIESQIRELEAVRDELLALRSKMMALLEDKTKGGDCR